MSVWHKQTLFGPEYGKYCLLSIHFKSSYGIISQVSAYQHILQPLRFACSSTTMLLKYNQSYHGIVISYQCFGFNIWKCKVSVNILLVCSRKVTEDQVSLALYSDLGTSPRYTLTIVDSSSRLVNKFAIFIVPQGRWV